MKIVYKHVIALVTRMLDVLENTKILDTLDAMARAARYSNYQAFCDAACVPVCSQNDCIEESSYSIMTSAGMAHFCKTHQYQFATERDNEIALLKSTIESLKKKGAKSRK